MFPWIALTLANNKIALAFVFLALVLGILPTAMGKVRIGYKKCAVSMIPAMRWALVLLSVLLALTLCGRQKADFEVVIGALCVMVAVAMAAWYLRGTLTTTALHSQGHLGGAQSD